MKGVTPGYVERQNAQVALQARMQIEYCERQQKERDEMAKGPRKAKQATTATALIEALAFVKVATSENSVLGGNAKHVRMNDNFAVAYDGQLAAGYPIAEELTLCPQIDQLGRALARSGKTLVISETDGGRLSVKGEKMRAFVPCLTLADIGEVEPDASIAVVDDRLKAAFKCCGLLAKEGEARVIGASLLLRSGDCTGTNGAAILQFWHGIDLPPNMVLPKVFCAAVAAVKAPLIGFGCSWREGRVGSVTFHFEGGAWLKSQTYQDEWPNTDQLWWQANYGPVPEGLFEAIETVADFNDEGFVTFANNAVQSHRDASIGAQYDVPGLQAGKAFAGKLMAQVGPWCAQVDLTTYPDRAFFVGGEAGTPVRGIIMGVAESTHDAVEPAAKEPEPTPEASQGGWSAPAGGGGWSSPADDFPIDDHIPF